MISKTLPSAKKPELEVQTILCYFNEVQELLCGGHWRRIHRKGMRGTFRVIAMLYIFIGILVTRVYTFIIFCTVPLRFVLSLHYTTIKIYMHIVVFSIFHMPFYTTSQYSHIWGDR